MLNSVASALAGEIHEAIRSRNISEVKKLLAANPALANAEDANGDTPIFYATWCGNSEIGKEIIELLLANKANIEARDWQGNTPFLYVLQDINMMLDFSAFFIERGANVHAANEADGKTALHWLAQQGSWDHNHEILKLILTHRPDLNVREYKNGQTPLHTSVWMGNLPFAELLIKSGADVNIKDYDGDAPLHFTNTWRSTIRFAKLLLENKADVSARNNNGYTTLQAARDREMVEFLFSHGADVGATGDAAKLLRAVYLGNTEEAEGLLREHPEQVNAKDNIGMTPILIAARLHDVPMAKLLVAYKADINAKPRHGRTALHKAIGARDREKIELAGSKNTSPAYEDFIRRNEELLSLLLAEKPDFSSQDSTGRTPLLLALDSYDWNLLTFLAEKGADVNAAGQNGVTPLLAAARGPGRIKQVESLLAHGADVKAKDKDGMTALHIAAKRGADEIVRLLLAKGANVHTKDRYERTALHYASACCHPKIVRMIVAYDADLNAKDNQGNSPLQYSTNPEVIELLRKYGAEGKSGREIFAGAGSWDDLILNKQKERSEKRKEYIKAHPLDANAVHNLEILKIIYESAWWYGILDDLIANPNALDKDGFTALFREVSYYGRIRIAKRLLEAKPDPNIRCGDKQRTALHEAALHGSPQIIDLLLQHKADPNIKDAEGRTPLSYALEEGRTNIVELLRKNKAKE